MAQLLTWVGATLMVALEDTAGSSRATTRVAPTNNIGQCFGKLLKDRYLMAENLIFDFRSLIFYLTINEIIDLGLLVF